MPTANPGNWCNPADGPKWPANDDNNNNCPLYVAEQAARNGVTVYVIGLGFGVEEAYLKEIARLGNGKSWVSANPADLRLIFAEILGNIYVRLVE